MQSQRTFVIACTGFVVFAFLLIAPDSRGALIAQYHLNESGGTTAADTTGLFNGTLSGAGASFVPGGISGNAISLDRAAGGYINIGTAFPGLATGDFSIVLWVKTTTTQADTVALGKHEAGSENGYFIAINTTGGGGVQNKATFVESEFVSNGTTSTTTVNDGGWHQLVGVYHAGGNESIYVDGSPAESTNSVNSMVTNTAPLLIGGINQSGTPTSRYSGLIDEVQIYNQALSDNQIDLLFANPTQSVPEPTGIVLVASVVMLLNRRGVRRVAAR